MLLTSIPFDFFEKSAVSWGVIFIHIFYFNSLKMIFFSFILFRKKLEAISIIEKINITMIMIDKDD